MSKSAEKLAGYQPCWEFHILRHITHSIADHIVHGEDYSCLLRFPFTEAQVLLSQGPFRNPELGPSQFAGNDVLLGIPIFVMGSRLKVTQPSQKSLTLADVMISTLTKTGGIYHGTLFLFSKSVLSKNGCSEQRVWIAECWQSKAWTSCGWISTSSWSSTQPKPLKKRPRARICSWATISSRTASATASFSSAPWLVLGLKVLD